MTVKDYCDITDQKLIEVFMYFEGALIEEYHKMLDFKYNHIESVKLENGTVPVIHLSSNIEIQNRNNKKYSAIDFISILDDDIFVRLSSDFIKDKNKIIHGIRYNYNAICFDIY